MLQIEAIVSVNLMMVSSSILWDSMGANGKASSKNK